MKFSNLDWHLEFGKSDVVQHGALSARVGRQLAFPGKETPLGGSAKLGATSVISRFKNTMNIIRFLTRAQNTLSPSSFLARGLHK